MNKFCHSDPLRKQVYDWEDAQRLAGIGMMRWSSIRNWTRKACRYYGVTPPKVIPAPKSGKGSRTSGYDPQHKTILLIPYHCNCIVVLHEAAHHIADELVGTDHGPIHSKYWWSIYCWLLLKFEVYERPFLRGSLKPYSLGLKPLAPSHFR